MEHPDSAGSRKAPQLVGTPHASAGVEPALTLTADSLGASVQIAVCAFDGYAGK